VHELHFAESKVHELHFAVHELQVHELHFAESSLAEAKLGRLKGDSMCCRTATSWQSWIPDMLHFVAATAYTLTPAQQMEGTTCAASFRQLHSCS